MPIKKENKGRYPENWPAIRNAILRRARDRCEFCHVHNYAVGTRDKNGIFKAIDATATTHKEALAIRNHKSCTCCGECECDPIIIIVLTIAHLDHQPENCNESNLKALCQSCHLTYDAKHHAENRRNIPGQMMLM